ncbi:MAG: hypothetical protein U0270_03725 [Labilithrix sp.]
MAQSPLAALKAKFESKEKLVAELEKFTKSDDLWVGRLNESKGLAHVSNAKLLRLHATFTAVKEKFGTRAKLIDAIADLEKRTKDEGYKTRLGNYPVPRLWDMYQSATKRQAAAKKASEPRKKAAAPAPKKVAAKKVVQTAAQKKTAAAKARK